MPDALLQDQLDRSIDALAVLNKHGWLASSAAAAACRKGEATPDQQKIVVEILDARIGL